jgi:hypothetical protein
MCDWWKLRPKLGQVCDIGAPHRIIANIHKLCRTLGLLTTYAQRGTSTKKLRYALGWKRLEANAAIEPTRMLHSQSAL